MIEDSDCDALEIVLQNTEVSGGFLLFIDSLGGFATAVERIITVCRAYRGTSEYGALVAGRAMSAATRVCL